MKNRLIFIACLLINTCAIAPKVYGNAVPQRSEGLRVSADGHRTGRFIVVDNLVAQGGHKRFAVVDDLMIKPPAEFDTNDQANAAQATLEAADVINIEKAPPTPALPLRRGLSAPVAVNAAGKLDNNTVATAGVNGEIILDDGDYNASDIVAVSGLRIHAKNPATLDTNGVLQAKVKINVPAGRDCIYVNDGVNDVYIGDIQFIGSTAIAADGKNSGLVVERCAGAGFENGKDTGFGRGTFIGRPLGWQPRNARIQDCSMRDSRSGWAIGWYRGDGDNAETGARGLDILDCDFVGILNGPKSNNVGNTSYNCSIRRCYYSGIGRCNSEIQGCLSGWTSEDNYQDEPFLSSVFNNNLTALGDSNIGHGKNNGPVANVIHRNIYRMTSKADGTGQRLAVEVGNLFNVMDNAAFGSGRNTFAAYFLGDSNGANSAWVQANPQWFWLNITNNKLVNINFGGGESGTWDRNANNQNNGPDVKLSDVMEQRLSKGYRPGPLRRAGSTTQPTDPQPPAFTPTLEALEPGTDAKYTGASVKVSFANLPVAAKTVTVDVQTPGGAFKGDQVMTPGTQALPATGGTLTKMRLHWNVQLRFQIRDANNVILGSSDWLNVTTKGVEDPAGTPPDKAQGSALLWPLATKPDPTTQPTNPPPPDPDYDLVIPRRNGVWQTPTTRKAA